MRFIAKYNTRHFTVLYSPLIIAVCTVMVFWIKPLTELLQYTRTGILSYKYHLLLTGHFTHWTLRHLCVDTLVFVVFSYLCMVLNFGNRYGLGRYVLYILIIALGSSCVVFVFYPEIQFYRGLSALDWGWYGIVMAQLWVGPHWVWKSGSILMGTVFIAEILLQLAFGHSMFVSSMGPGVANMPGVHVAGVACGLICAFFYHKWGRR